MDFFQGYFSSICHWQLCDELMKFLIFILPSPSTSPSWPKVTPILNPPILNSPAEISKRNFLIPRNSLNSLKATHYSLGENVRIYKIEDVRQTMQLCHNNLTKRISIPSKKQAQDILFKNNTTWTKKFFTKEIKSKISKEIF